MKWPRHWCNFLFFLKHEKIKTWLIAQVTWNPSPKSISPVCRGPNNLRNWLLLLLLLLRPEITASRSDDGCYSKAKGPSKSPVPQSRAVSAIAFGNFASSESAFGHRCTEFCFVVALLELSSRLLPFSGPNILWSNHIRLLGLLLERSPSEEDLQSKSSCSVDHQLSNFFSQRK